MQQRVCFLTMMKLDFNNKEVSKISSQYLIMKQQLDNPWVKEEITNILKWVIMKATYQYIWGAAKMQMIQK